MNDKNPFSNEAVQNRIRSIGYVRVSLWFLALGIAACIPGSIVAAWRGSEPSPTELVLRFALAFVSMGIALAVFLWLIARHGAVGPKP